MNLLDLALIGLLIWQLVRGARAGFTRQAITLVSFFVAILLAVIISPVVVPLFGNIWPRPILSLVIFALILLLVSALSEVISHKTTQKLQGHKKIESLDRVGGAILGLVLTIISIWLLAAIFSSSAWPRVSRQIKSSRIVRIVDAAMPTPPPVIAQIQNYLSDLSFPKVFVGLEPELEPPANLPEQADVRAVALKAQDSVVKIEAGGCGNYLSDGSGFVVAPNLVVTNAHVVAGTRRPDIIDRSGRHASTIVYFDSDVDLAVLRTSGLSGDPLKVNYTPMARGGQGVVLGYPGGGGYSAVSAVVIDKIIAFGRNIYGDGEVRRPVYALGTRVVPGNSGGPLVNMNGEVAGVIFASSQTDDKVGYSLTAETLRSPLEAAQANTATVSSGRCMSR